MISRQSKLKLWLAASCLAAAFFGGWEVVASRLSREREALSRDANTREELIARLRAERARIEAGNRPAGAPISSPSAPPEDGAPRDGSERRRQAPGQLARLVGNGAIELKIVPGLHDALSPDDTGAFPDSFAQLFGLEAEEWASLRDGMIALKQRVDALIVARSTVTVDSGVVTMSFEPLPEGEGLRTELRDLMTATLGPERFEAFLTLRSPADPRKVPATVWTALASFNRQPPGTGGIDDFYYAFGMDGAVTTVRPGGHGYVVQRVRPHPERPDTYYAPSDIRDRAELLHLLGPQAALLPAAF